MKGVTEQRRAEDMILGCFVSDLPFGVPHILFARTRSVAMVIMEILIKTMITRVQPFTRRT